MNFLKQLDIKPQAYMRYFFLIVSALIVAMIIVSEYDRSPDEIHHFNAAKYYINHLFPPEFSNPEIRNSYSVFGVSYLNYHFFEYFFAGKFAWILSHLTSNELISIRLFNAFLFAIFSVWFLFDESESSLFFIFLLISPQIWYVFSYANNDAFALFVSMIIAYQVATEKSSFQRYLLNDFKLGGSLFALLIGVTLTLKTNYYIFLIFIGLWLLYKFKAKYARKFVYISVVAMLVFTFRCGLDFYVNGETNFVGLSYLNYFSSNFEKNRSKLLEIQEQYAEQKYKPSAFENNLANTDSSMKLKAKGVPIENLFTEYNWHEISFRSFVGTYGYMNIFAPDKYYLLMKILFAMFGIYIFCSMLFAKRYTETLITIFCVLLTIFVSIYLSWTYAVQAQGRYLFPIIPMISVLVYANRQFIRNFFTNTFVTIAFLLSVYSFVFIGLKYINN